MYADNMTESMRKAIDETNRRREIQQKYNETHGITPRGVAKEISEGLRAIIPQKDEDLKEKINLNKIPKRRVRKSHQRPDWSNELSQC